MTYVITRSPTHCADCLQLQGDQHLPGCQYKRFTWRITAPALSGDTAKEG